ncbi:glutaredoxin family protein [Halomonas caseinilytica]|uniref:glutaredoxin family protein n=1 Tax=Halomonas caseinilytica TaxID=438744 RepID=UPI000AD21348|nr:glutaredoxin family protein [Halomonas caseinilytica]
MTAESEEVIHLTLYTTTGCHLCEALEAWLGRLASEPVRLERVEVADDAALMATYATRLPVLKDAAGTELDGGHEPECLAAWLADRGWLDTAAWQEVAQPSDAEGPRRHGAVMRQGRRYLGGGP